MWISKKMWKELEEKIAALEEKQLSTDSTIYQYLDKEAQSLDELRQTITRAIETTR